MTKHSRDRSTIDYRIAIEPLNGTVTARRGEQVIASSRNAKVMYETRLSPVIYFPPDDVRADVLEPSDHRTFCPFRGTATYAHLALPGDHVPNAAWRYANVLPEGQAVQDHVAFMPDVVSDYSFSDEQPIPPPRQHITGPLVDWVMREASGAANAETLTRQFAQKLLENGVGIFRLSILIWSLHPLIAGKNYIWRRSSGEVVTREPSYGIHTDPAFANSPLRHVSDGLGGVRQRLRAGNGEEFSFTILNELKAEGATDYVAMPLRYSNGRINVMTLASDHPAGFTTAHLGLIFECSSVISRYFEVFTQRENAQSLLETYLGKRTGARVLGGEIRRGDGEEIAAAILFCDLRHSSALEEHLDKHAYLDLLNHFFEVTTEIVNAHDGEVLKFIGDAVLAIFPAGDDRSHACCQAVSAARSMLRQFAESADNAGKHAIDCAIGIDFGDVTYGNVGSRERLDFTVIGQAANISARLGEFGKQTGHRIVASENVVSPDPDIEDLGRIGLHNVSDPVHAFAIK